MSKRMREGKCVEWCSYKIQFVIFSFILKQWIQWMFSCPAAHSFIMVAAQNAPGTILNSKTLVKNLFNIILLYLVSFVFTFFLLLLIFIARIAGIGKISDKIRTSHRARPHTHILELYYNNVDNGNNKYYESNTYTTTTKTNCNNVWHCEGKKVHRDRNKNFHSRKKGNDNQLTC